MNQLNVKQRHHSQPLPQQQQHVCDAICARNIKWSERSHNTSGTQTDSPLTDTGRELIRGDDISNCNELSWNSCIAQNFTSRHAGYKYRVRNKSQTSTTTASPSSNKSISTSTDKWSQKATTCACLIGWILCCPCWTLGFLLREQPPSSTSQADPDPDPCWPCNSNRS